MFVDETRAPPLQPQRGRMFVDETRAPPLQPQRGRMFVDETRAPPLQPQRGNYVCRNLSWLPLTLQDVCRSNNDLQGRN